jgi:hypothetical protein
MGGNSGQTGQKITTRLRRKSQAHPYEKLQSMPIWNLVDQAIAALLKNGDIELTTGREYVVGYICKTVVESSVTTTARKFK